MLIQRLRKRGVIKVLQINNGLPEDPTNTDTLNYSFFCKIFNTLRAALKQKLQAPSQNIPSAD